MTKVIPEPQNKRILWIDLFRVLAICLVVIGHITPYYNKYIYQFHMAAFFWISGYCTSWDNHSKAHIIWQRFCSLIFPLVSIFALGTLLMSILYKAGIYPLFYDSLHPWIGGMDALKLWLLQGKNYVWWMGATWFVSVLFGIIVVHAFLLSLEAKFPKVRHLYLLFFSCIYILGIYCAKNGIYARNIDLIMIGQLYYGLGILYKKNKIGNRRYNHPLIVWSIILICNIGFLIILGNIPYITVDYPSRVFHYYFLSVFAALNGISFLVCLSKLISQIIEKIAYARKFILYIAQHTVAIVFFHFVMFKACIALLVAANIVPLTYLQVITPTKDDIGQRYLFLFLSIGVLGSTALWKLLTIIPGMRVLLGEEKNNKIWESHIALVIRKSVLNTIENCKKWLRQFVAEEYVNKPLLYGIGIEFIMLSILIIRQGIILNDDLNSYLARQNGYFHFLINSLKNELRMGRPLRLIGGFNYSLAFLTNNVYFNRFIQCLFIGLCVIQFARLTHNLFKNRNIAIVTTILIISCMPLTFEHSAPNAFISLVILPLWHLSISLNNWVRYLRTGEKKFFWWYLVAWVVALQGYEFVVTYTPIYVLIYLFEKGINKNTLKETFYKCLPPVIAGIIYIAATILFGKIFPSQYSGTVLTFISVKSSFEIIKTLALSAIPGYFLFNNKYLFLFNLYSHECVRDIYNAVLAKDIGSIFINDFYLDKLGELAKDIWLFPTNIVRLLVLIFIVLSVRKLSQTASDEPGEQNKFRLGIFLSLLGYILIPSVPNSLSSLYQGNVNAASFTSLPISMFLFFTVCLLISYVICMTWTKWHRSVYIHCILIFLFGLSVQTMNIVFANESEHNFKRITMVEDLFESNCLRNLDGTTIYAPDLFETRNALAVSNNFWTQIASNNQISLNFTEDENAAVKIFFINDEYFCIVTETEIAVLSPHVKNDLFLVATDINNYVAVRSGVWQYDGQFFCYRFENRGDKLIVLDNENSAFYNYEPYVGDTLVTADIQGMYDDGWCSTSVQIRIDSGQDGKICFSGWFPEEIKLESGYTISVYCDERLTQTYSLQEQVINIVLDISPNTITTIELRSNFTIRNTNGDLRELSFILYDVH